jgi:uncharacterized protein YyaL (SSP411 family)
VPNRLINSSSPYLIQHADNPVDWFPWGEEALKISQQEDKPIFLSIGYAACHWCHVMAHESFEDPATAELMNKLFVNIKVDREERPDIDDIYMDAVVALTGQGGWPLSVFLTPDQQPFYGGTYFPPVSRYNMPAFRDVLLSVAKTWEEDRDRLLNAGTQVVEYIKKNQSLPGESTELSKEYLDRAASSLIQNYDWQHGGWGAAPKFPQPMAIDFLLRRVSRGNNQSMEIVDHALRSMAKGGMYDLIGGGFARYSTDNDWLVPHFEKMLYDNAQLARVYFRAYLITGETYFRRVCEDTLAFVKREMTHPKGGYYSSLDADSEGEEGKYYIWTEDDIREAIGDTQESEFILAAYGFMEGGNFEGKTIPRRVLDDQQLADKFGLAIEDVSANLTKLNERLLEVREKRIRPGLDDKVLVAWNCWMDLVYLEIGRYLGISWCEDMATRNISFILDEMLDGDRLFRSWRSGNAVHDAYLEDYASLIIALLSLYTSDPDPKWFETALMLSESMITHFYGTDDLFYDTRDDHESLLIRPRELQDNATPSGNALAAYALLQIAAYQGDGKLRDLAEKMLRGVQEVIVKYPTAFSQWLYALDFALHPIREVAIIGDPNDLRTQSLVQTLWSQYRPDVIAAISESPPSPGAPALLENRPQTNMAPTAYVCEGFVCQRPVNEVDQFREQLEDFPGQQ